MTLNNVWVRTSYQHDFNGAAEVLNKSVEVMLRHVVSEHPERDFDEYLPLVQWAYNSSKHSTTNVTPYYAMWGYEPLITSFGYSEV